MKYIKKPIAVEAIQWTGKNQEELEAFGCSFYDGLLLIITPEGTMEACIGDWIIKGVKGELYPCKPDVFELTYEQEDEQ